MMNTSNEIVPISIEDELKQSYLDYAMSVIVGRALPDVRDGLKPVHRRVLYAMQQLKNDWNKPYKKSARVVGDVIGKYHPHGDTAVYDTIVRMAQPFSMRSLLVDGQGNFGSVDGDSPAAMRYTEVRMTKLAHSLLADLEKETVDFAPNYDGSEFAPTVLPTRVPNLLINGSSGIAVGMATNMPPHNPTEVLNACFYLIANPQATIEELMEYIPGPDFPTGAIINGRNGIIRAYKTGRGRVVLRAKTRIEVDEKTNKQTIIVEELPYQVNKAKLVEKIAELSRDKRVEGITALRDESDKDGMRVVIECRRGDDAQITLNKLYAHTSLQHVFGINNVALVDNQPKLLNLKQILEAFIAHRREVVTRRTIFELRKARARAHTLEGLGVALLNIDEVVQMIKAAKSPQLAKEALIGATWQAGQVRELLERAGDVHCRPEDCLAQYGMQEDGYHLSPEQAQAILELRLHRLTGLEQEKLFKEYEDIVTHIANLIEILSNPDRLIEVICEELTEIKEMFSDARRSEIRETEEDLSLEDLIEQEEVVVTLSQAGYVKAQPVEQYQAQRRGGKGKMATTMKEEDFIEKMVMANTHDTILCFSNYGKVYWLKVYQLPQATRLSKGRPIINILPLQKDETIEAILPLREQASENAPQFVFFATRLGRVKKVSLEAFSRPRSTGIIAIELEESDRLVAVNLTTGSQDIMVFGSHGKAIRFNEGDVRTMGRTARGVRGIKLPQEIHVISMVVINSDDGLLIATANGYGKRTPQVEFKTIGRGGMGVIAIQCSKRNGALVGAAQVSTQDDVMLITTGGTMVRTPVADISQVGRNAQGVRLINLNEGEQLVTLSAVPELEEEGAQTEIVSA